MCNKRPSSDLRLLLVWIFCRRRPTTTTTKATILVNQLSSCLLLVGSDNVEMAMDEIMDE
jgi:hypothetical protein